MTDAYSTAHSPSPAPRLFPLDVLDGCEIVRWVGMEMALEGGVFPGPKGADDLQREAVVWDHPAVPYLQFVAIDVVLADGRVFTLHSQLDDGTGYYGFYVVASDAPYVYEAEHGEFDLYRTRDLGELPLGVASVGGVLRERPNAIVEFTLTIGDRVVRLLAAEVSDDMKILVGDESVLVQLDGVKPERRWTPVAP